MTGGAAPAEAYLFGASGIHRGERYTLDREASVLGRGEDAHVRLADPQASRHHCEVRRNEGGFLLRDLLSKNGTSVNGLPVSEKLLEQGDEIRIGETVFFFTFRAKVSPSELLSTRERIEFEDLAARVTMARGPLAGGLVGQDEKMKEIYRQIEKIAAVDVPILVRGETGTGKDLVARTIHENSRRRGHPFVPVNCAALPREILESELFGHEKGAFTGAHAARAGLFEEATGGTIFLDEVTEMDPSCQVALLRVLAEKKIRRVGGNEEIQVDVRVVSATNRDLEAMIAEGAFRQDLYYRLNAVEIRVPALRERKSDIPVLAEHFVRLFGGQARRRVKGIAKEAIERLERYPWPGNVRELRNALERAVVMGVTPTVGAQDILLPEKFVDPGAQPPSIAEVEAAHIARVLAFTGRNISETARILGIQRSTLYRKIKEYALE